MIERLSKITRNCVDELFRSMTSYSVRYEGMNSEGIPEDIPCVSVIDIYKKGTLGKESESNTNGYIALHLPPSVAENTLINMLGGRNSEFGKLGISSITREILNIIAGRLKGALNDLFKDVVLSLPRIKGVGSDNEKLSDCRKYFLKFCVKDTCFFVEFCFTNDIAEELAG